MAPTSIRLERVSKRFDHTVKGEVYAVRDVNLSVAEGELLTLLGPSGCGKSTTLRMIAGFEEPDEGTISIAGRDVTHVLPNKRGIGFMFQNYALFPHLSIFENVAYGLRVQGKAEAEIVRQVADVLELVGLAKYERQQPHQLSGGEQQRVALARAVVGDGRRHMPPPIACIAVSAVLAFVALWPLCVAAGVTDLPVPQTSVTIGGVFVGRGLAGFVPRWRELFSDEPFATRDRRYYSPLCIVLGLGYAALGSADFAA